MPARFPDGMKETGPLALGRPRHRSRLGGTSSSLWHSAMAVVVRGRNRIGGSWPPGIESARRAHPRTSPELAADPGCAALYLPNGKGFWPTARPCASRHLHTLRRVAERGADGFDSGETAASIAAYFAAHGGLMREEDLARYRPFWAEPATTDYRGHRVLVMPPNSYGLLFC